MAVKRNLNELNINENDNPIFIMGIDPEFLKKCMENKTDETDIIKQVLNTKKIHAKEIVSIAARNAIVVGMDPNPFVDATIISMIEMIEINGLAEIYRIKEYDESMELLKHILEIGTVGEAVKEAIDLLRKTTNVNISLVHLNSIIAGAIAGAIGISSIYIFEQIYLGNHSVEDINWITEILNSKLSADFIKKAQELTKNLSNDVDISLIIEYILNLFVK